MTIYFKDRAQFKSPVTGRWIKVDTRTGKMIAIKQTSLPYAKIRIQENA